MNFFPPRLIPPPPHGGKMGGGIIESLIYLETTQLSNVPHYALDSAKLWLGRRAPAKQHMSAIWPTFCAALAAK